MSVNIDLRNERIMVDFSEGQGTFKGEKRNRHKSGSWNVGKVDFSITSRRLV